MKKSEYLEGRKSHWLKYFQDPESVSSEDNVSGPAAQRANMDALAAEAAGVAWDSEEPFLPDEIMVGYFGASPMLRPSPSSIPHGISWPDALTQEATYREAVRRYNAWPELEKLAEKMGPGYGLCGGCEIYHGKLLTILRGGPQ